MTTVWKAVLGVILIFIFGFISGIACTSIFIHHKMEAFLKHPGATVTAALETRLTGNLSLDADQKQKVDQLFDDNLKQRKEMQKQIQPQIRMLNLETIRQINVLLKPEQQERFHQNVEQLRKRIGQTAFNGNPEEQPEPTSVPAPPAH